MVDHNPSMGGEWDGPVVSVGVWKRRGGLRKTVKQREEGKKGRSASMYAGAQMQLRSLKQRDAGQQSKQDRRQRLETGLAYRVHRVYLNE